MEAALSKKIMAPLGALEVEAKAFEAGLLFAKDIGIQELVLEGGSITIYNALCEISSPPSSVEPIIVGVNALCSDFRRVEFSHVRRQGNSPADLGPVWISCLKMCVLKTSVFKTCVWKTPF